MISLLRAPVMAPQVGAAPKTASTTSSAPKPVSRTSSKQKLDQLYLHIKQLKNKETNLLGAREHPKGLYESHPFLLEEDLLGLGLNQNCTLEGTMLEFLQVLLSQPRDHVLAPYLSLPQAQEQLDLPELSQLAGSYTPAFLKTKHVLLRELVFNNHTVGPINQRNDLTDEGKWREWRSNFVGANQWLTQTDPEGSGIDLNYLQSSFKDFNTFATAVRLLQNWAMDSSDNLAAWTERFLIPSGPYTSFWQLTPERTATNASLNGAGQILYYALMRSVTKESIELYQKWAKQAHERSLHPELRVKEQLPQHLSAMVNQVAHQLYERFFGQHDIFNRCAQQVEGPYAQAEIELQQLVAQLATNANWKERYSAFEHLVIERKAQWPMGQLTVEQLNPLNYFPLKGHRIFVQMLGDYDNILAQSLTLQDLFEALGTITLLNLMVLGLEQSQGACTLYNSAKPVDISMIPAVNTSPKDRMRKAALMRCKANYELHPNMLQWYCYTHLTKLITQLEPKLSNVRALKKAQLNLLFIVIFRLFSCNTQFQAELKVNLVKRLAALKGVSDGIGSPEERIEALRVSYKDFVKALVQCMDAKKSFNNNYHRVLGRQIGLITTELTTGHCYILSDQLVTTLVMAILGKSRHLPWQDFLQVLAERYHIIIGVKQARANYAKGGRYYGSLRLGDLDEEFRKNERALRIKLERLGLLLVLSDGCDFVKNPFYAAGSNPQP